MHVFLRPPEVVTTQRYGPKLDLSGPSTLQRAIEARLEGLVLKDPDR